MSTAAQQRANRHADRPRDAHANLPFASHTTAMESGAAHAWQVHYRAIARRDSGEDVIVLSVGDPDFDTPAPIVDATVASLRAGDTHYSVSGGVGPLADRIAEVESVRLGKSVSADQVVTFGGAQNALFSVFNCLLDRGDEALLLGPPYTMFAGLAYACGASAREAPLDVANGFALDIDVIEQALMPNTRVLLANFPHNPSGALASPDALRALVALCRERGIWLVSDEAYSDLVYDGEFVSPGSLEGDTSHVIVVRSLSKSHAMTGWRIGWTVTTPALSAHLRNLVAYVNYGSPEFVQVGALAALTHELPQVALMKAAYRARRDAFVAAVNTVPGFKTACPAAGIFCVADVSATGLDGTTFATRLLDEAGVSVLTGAAFSAVLNNHVRIALCESESRLREAAARIEQFVRSL